MPRADIYRLPHSPDGGVRFACRLTQKAFQQGYAVHLQISDRQHAAALDKALWDFRPDSFVPHTLSDAGAEDRPARIVVPAPVSPDSASRDASPSDATSPGSSGSASPSSASRDTSSSDPASPGPASRDAAPPDAASPGSVPSDTASPDPASRDASPSDGASPGSVPSDPVSPDSASRDASSPDPAPSDTVSSGPKAGEDAQSPQLLAFLGEPPDAAPDCERVAEILITEDETRAAERLEFYRKQGYEVYAHSIPAS